MSVGLVDESKDTKVSVLKNSDKGTEYESTSFSERKTVEELKSDVAFKNLTLMMSKIQTLIKLLKGWLK
jgi:phage I-like protein